MFIFKTSCYKTLLIVANTHRATQLWKLHTQGFTRGKLGRACEPRRLGMQEAWNLGTCIPVTAYNVTDRKL